MYTTPSIDEPHFDLDVTLGLFDGISCGQEALKRAGITTRIYLASEIEKYPKIITRKNHPLTVQLGDVRDVKGENLPKVDLILGGSPCTGFSFAGKGLAFDDPRSALFFEFVRVLEECREFNPEVKFLLENVRMKQEFQDIISEHLKVQPVKINSSLISAQSRKRLYWTNIPGVSQPDDLQINLIDVIENGYVEEEKSATIKNQYYKSSKANFERSGTFHATGVITNRPITQPEDKGIVLKDILEESPEDYTLMSDKFVNRNKDAGCLVDSDKPKASNLSAMEYVKNGRQGDYIKSDKNGRPTKPKVLIVPEQVRVRKHEVDIESLQHCLLNALENSNKTKKQVAEELNDKFSTVEHYFRKVGSEFFCIPSENHWFELKEILNIETDEFDAPITEFEIRDGRYDMADRVYNPEYKAPTVIASGVAKVLCGRVVGRKINPETGKRDDYNPDLKMEQRLEPRLDEKSGTLTTVTKDNVVVLNENQKRRIDKINTTTDKANCLTEAIGRGGSSSEFLTSVKKKTLVLEAPTYRKLTCVECERLQTLSDNYTEGISNTQRYKALGNGWTIDVIVHILQGLKWQS